MDRRKFIKKGGQFGVGFLGLKTYVLSPKLIKIASQEKIPTSPKSWAKGYGRLRKDSRGILSLPKGFSYEIISKKGDKMSDGFLVPGLADGMATFQGSGDNIIIIRNHEVSPKDIKNGAFGKKLKLINKLSSNDFYDYGRGKNPCLGGTTSIIYNTKSNKIEKQYLSLTGTIRNCAGGLTPWNSWISCEENTNKADKYLEKDHGYNFEVPASEEIQLFAPVPLKDMGRFNHEAVCVDPRTSIVYQTEDRYDGLIYRFISNTPGKLNLGGKLQILAIKDSKSFDTRNWPESKGDKMKLGEKYRVEWLDIDDVNAPKDDLRYRGFKNGAAVFARGEGMWFGDNECYFACTNGGKKKHGQIFRYTPSTHEGTPQENDSPGTIELFIEPNNSKMVKSCDNVTIGGNGDLVICEDKKTPRIVGVTPDGNIYHIAKNIGYLSEFAGATFSPDGQILFVNIQGPGLTLAIKGPWAYREGA